MALPFFSGRVKRRDQIVSVDLGAHRTKAVYVCRHGETLSLAGYVLKEAPNYDGKLAAADLAQHLKEVHQALGAQTKAVTVVLGVEKSLLRQVEMAIAPISEMRARLKDNPKNYLQQEPRAPYVFDCYIPLASALAAPAEGAKPNTKAKVIVGGAEEKVVAEWVEAIKLAGLVPDQIVPNLVGPVNALERAQPEAFAKEALAVVDLGYKNTTICLVKGGELVLSRVVAIGGEKLTMGLQEAMGVSATEAENLKIGMPQEVALALQPLLSPLGRELRASLDFFEHQHDKPVGQVYVCGAAARSEYFLQALQEELMVPCKVWNPAEGLQLTLSSEQQVELEQRAHELVVAIGVAVAGF